MIHAIKKDITWILLTQKIHKKMINVIKTSIKTSWSIRIFQTIISERQSLTFMTTILAYKHYLLKFMTHLFEFLLLYYPLWSATVLKRLGFRRDSNAWKHLKRNILGSKLRLLPQIFIRETEPYIRTAFANRRCGFEKLKKYEEVESGIAYDPDKFEIINF